MAIRSMRQKLPAPPQPWADLQTKVSLRVTRASRKRAGSTGTAALVSTALIVSSAMPSAPMIPGLGGTTTSLPVCRATAAARASDAKGMPWQNTTRPTGRAPFTRFR